MNTEPAKWKNTEETLGSDYYKVATQFPASGIKKKIGATKITDWHSFRTARNRTTSSIDSIQECIAQIHADVKNCTTKVALTTDAPAADSYLLHL
ncbi:hypothetical protein HPB48_026055 [Haemaphysalis longicornis]|uniref:Uncharacterized protein n=1 Tax=Haemaphysalis longicornis TaxID=44386 RepID=A0A9J6HB36_HAELO|nr:hypothetical protein HPB48_026055 [Haemaphysalis longicornis]